MTRSSRPSRVLTRALARVAVLGLATASLLAVQVAGVGADLSGAAAAPRPVATRVDTAPLRAVTTGALRATAGTGGSAARAPSARSGAQSMSVAIADRLAVVGITWPAGRLAADDRVQVRVEHGPTWGAWEDVAREDPEHGPDQGTAEAKAARTDRQGTAPYVAIGSAVQARVLSTHATLAAGLDLEVVQPGTSPADAASDSTPAGSASAITYRPTIRTRAQWGADESIRRGSPSYGQVHLAFVHHTDGSNSYAAGDVPAIIRGIYTFHVKGRGWNDIGYNFLVDRWGRIWEGRYGGVTKAVIGAHTLDYNSWSFGVSVMGTFTTHAPPTAVKNSLAQLIAWKLSIHGVQLPGTTVANGRTFNIVSGHRDANQTACPGQLLYNALPSIRASARSRMGTLSRTVIARDADGAGQPDVLAYPTPGPAGGTSGPVRLFTSAPLGAVGTRTNIGAGGWNALRTATLSPDVTDDGKADIIAQDPASGRLRTYAGDGAGGVRPGYVTSGTGWGTMLSVLPVGDLNGDGHGDLMAVGKHGSMYFYPGTGDGRFPGRVFISAGWTAYRKLLGGRGPHR